MAAPSRSSPSFPLPFSPLLSSFPAAAQQLQAESHRENSSPARSSSNQRPASHQAAVAGETAATAVHGEAHDSSNEPTSSSSGNNNTKQLPATPDINTSDQQLREQHLPPPLSFSAKNQSKY
uniref:Uncharacterized protein n=1 Tax=Solanum tuberosum TaxID=4113 RepID=M1BZV3_SOLTU